MSLNKSTSIYCVLLCSSKNANQRKQWWPGILKLLQNTTAQTGVCNESARFQRSQNSVLIRWNSSHSRGNDTQKMILRCILGLRQTPVCKTPNGCENSKWPAMIYDPEIFKAHWPHYKCLASISLICQQTYTRSPRHKIFNETNWQTNHFWEMKQTLQK